MNTYGKQQYEIPQRLKNFKKNVSSILWIFVHNLHFSSLQNSKMVNFGIDQIHLPKIEMTEKSAP